MATEWYYLDRNEQHGPVTGKKLRELADFGAVFPWTPVRRIHNGDSSPWTRAGAVQALFSGDVSDQLRPPICDDCGTAKPDGSCPKCDVEELAPILVEQIDHVPDAPPQTTGWTTVKSRYQDLRWYISVIRVFAFGELFLFGGAGAILVVSSFSRQSEDSFANFATGSSYVMAGLLSFIFSMVVAGFLELAIDTEENTRQLVADNRAKTEAYK